MSDVHPLFKPLTDFIGGNSKTAKLPAIHWAGGLRIERGERLIKMLPGFPACVSGDRAIRIANEGTQTWEKSRVTCKRCLKLLDVP